MMMVLFLVFSLSGGLLSRILVVFCWSFLA